MDANGNGYLEGVTLRFLAELPNSTVDQGFGNGTGQYWVYWTYSTTTSAPSYTYPNVTGPPITAFNDSSMSKTVYFPEPGNQTVYLRIPKNCHILSSNLSLQANYQLVEVATVNNGGSRNHGIHIGDVDNDGLNEIIGGRNDGDIHLWEWNGSYYQMKSTSYDVGFQAYGLAVADSNQNGSLDLIIGQGGGRGIIYEWKNVTGVVTTEGLVFNKGLTSGGIFTVYMGDSDNDGRDEVLFGSAEGGVGHVWVYRWNGTGYEENYTLTLDEDVYSVVVADCDNLPGNELIIARGFSTEIYKWNGTEYLLDCTVKYGVFSLSIGDCDNDGLSELATGSGSLAHIWIYNWNSSGLLESSKNVSINFNDQVEGVRIGDIDNDGRNELLGSDLQGNLKLFKWNGTHYHATWSGRYGSSLGRYDSLQIGDADNDGLNEVVFGEESPNIRVLEFFGVLNGSLNVGADGDNEWAQVGIFNDSIVIGDLSTEIEAALMGLDPDAEGYCNIPMRIYNNYTGNLTLCNPIIIYETADYRFLEPAANNSDLIYYLKEVEALDSDTDGLSDFAEDMLYGTNPYNTDTDADGLTDWAEAYGITSPLLWDTDGDGLNDSYELYFLPTNPINNDTDDDLLSDGEELLIYGTDPLLNDTDADYLIDGAEIARGTDPHNPDTDADGLLDGLDDDPLVPWWRIYVILAVLIPLAILGIGIFLRSRRKKRCRARRRQQLWEGIHRSRLPPSG